MIEKPTHREQLTPIAGGEGRVAGNYRTFGRRRPLKLILLAAVVLVVLLAIISAVIQKGLWMGELGYSGVFWKLLSVRWGLFCVAFIVAFLYLWVNVRLAARNGATLPAGHLMASESDIAARIGIAYWIMAGAAAALCWGQSGDGAHTR